MPKPKKSRVRNPALAGVRPPPPGQGKRGEKGHLAYLLRQAQAATRLTLERALADLGVTPPQFAVLTMLKAYPGLSGADLARVALLTPQTVGVIIRNLERDGAIRKNPHPVHGRVLQWTLTRRGETLLGKCRRPRQGAGAPAAGRACRRRRRSRSGAGCPKLPQTCSRMASSRGRNFCRGPPCAVRLSPMKQPDSLKTPTRRALLRSGLGAGALLALPARGVGRGAARLRSMARRLSRPRAGQGHFGGDLYAGDGPHRAGHDRVQADAAPAGIQRGDLAIHQSPRLGLAHHRRQGSAAEERGGVCADRA